MVKRGDVFYAALDPRIGSEQGGLRPVVVVQNNQGNRYSPTLVVVPLTTQHKPSLPTHVILPHGSCDNLEPSTALTEQVTTIDTSRLLAYVGRLDVYYMGLVDRALRVSLDLVI